MIEHEWTFFSNYAHVLIFLAQNPGALLREVADRVGVTERTAVRLINQLDEAGILKRVKQGRRNVYRITTNEYLRHPLEAHCTIEELLKPILRPGEETATDLTVTKNPKTGHSGAREPLTEQTQPEHRQ